jgi:hypothetical protein
LSPSINPSANPSIVSTIVPSVYPSTNKPTTLPTEKTTYNFNSSELLKAYHQVREDLDAYVSAHNDSFSKSNLYGIAVRLPFHDAAEIDIRTSDLMGSDGCLSSSSDNNGLIEPTSLVNTVINAMYNANYSSVMSRADFWVLFANHVIAKASGDKVTIPFYYGRSDNAECSEGEGRLPNAQQTNAITKVFVEQMGLNVTDAGQYTVYG